VSAFLGRLVAVMRALRDADPAVTAILRIRSAVTRLSLEERERVLVYCWDKYVTAEKRRVAREELEQAIAMAREASEGAVKAASDLGAAFKDLKQRPS